MFFNAVLLRTSGLFIVFDVNVQTVTWMVYWERCLAVSQTFACLLTLLRDVTRTQFTQTTSCTRRKYAHTNRRPSLRLDVFVACLFFFLRRFFFALRLVSLKITHNNVGQIFQFFLSRISVFFLTVWQIAIRAFTTFERNVFVIWVEPYAHDRYANSTLGTLFATHNLNPVLLDRQN